MIPWTPPPETVSWALPEGTAHDGTRYAEIRLRAPTGADVLKATALPPASDMDLNIRLIETVSGVPYDVVKQQPEHRLLQMAAYMDAFAGAPAPDPLEAWYRERRAAVARDGTQAETPAPG